MTREEKHVSMEDLAGEGVTKGESGIVDKIITFVSGKYWRNMEHPSQISRRQYFQQKPKWGRDSIIFLFSSEQTITNCSGIYARLGRRLRH